MNTTIQTPKKDPSKKTDLRIIKTKRNLKTEMKKLMKQKPLKKITVTELTANALINKGTFYLHYTDIYALYEEVICDYFKTSLGSLNYYEDFFLAPQKFVYRFLTDFEFQKLDEEFPFLHNEEYMLSLPIPCMVSDTIVMQLFHTGYLPETLENHVKLVSAISSFIEPYIQLSTLLDAPDSVELISSVSGDIIAHLFQGH